MAADAAPVCAEASVGVTPPYACAFGSGGNRRGAAVFLAFILLTCSAPPSRAQGIPPYHVKAASLVGLAQFTKWPPSSFPATNSPIVIGVLGVNPFGDALRTAAERTGEVRDRSVIIKYSRKLDDLRACHVLFICESERARTRQILASLKDQSILTVGEVEDFTKHGGIISFYLKGRTFGLEINNERAKRNGLAIDTRALNLARIVSW